MGQRLRVAGWLRFTSKAQLTRGLKGFKEREAPGYYEARHWEIDGLDARIRLEAELPGDFNSVETPFLAMVKAAGCGYVDYFEAGNTNNQTQGRDPVKRWNRHAYDKLPKLMASPTMFALGTGVVGFSREQAVLLVRGTLTFANESAASAGASMPLPYLTEREIREVRVPATRSGRKLTFFAAVRAPLYKTRSIMEAPVVAWARAISAGPTGTLSVEAPCGEESWLHTIKKGVESSSFLRQAVKVEKGMTKISGEAATPVFGNG